MQAHAPQPTLAQWLAAQVWSIPSELSTSSRQKDPSQKEAHKYNFFERVERVDELPMMAGYRGRVDSLLARTDTVAELARMWHGTRTTDVVYRAESELEDHLATVWRALNSGLASDIGAEYPEAIRNAPWKQRAVTGGYHGQETGIKYDIGLYIQTGAYLGDLATKDTVYLLVEVKTERAMLAKLDEVEARIKVSAMPHRRLEDLGQGDRMLVQVSTHSVLKGYSD